MQCGDLAPESVNSVPRWTYLTRTACPMRLLEAWDALYDPWEYWRQITALTVNQADDRVRGTWTAKPQQRSSANAGRRSMSL